MKIYFAGSIRGGRDDKDLYLEIIKLLKTYGEVLTEHVGSVDLSSMGEEKTAEFIFDRDVEWLKSSDFVVAEVTSPSLGVGYELGLAETLNKKVICLYREKPEKFLSAMIAGNKAFQVEIYKDINDLGEVFNKYLK
jgi:nucleoside 2-deoxyribosyltransferase